MNQIKEVAMPLDNALRQAELRETQLTLQFQTKRDRIAQLLGVLSRIDAEPGPLLLLHPTGPLGTVRSGMMLADVTPASFDFCRAGRLARSSPSRRPGGGGTMSAGWRAGHYDDWRLCGNCQKHCFAGRAGGEPGGA